MTPAPASRLEYLGQDEAMSDRENRKAWVIEAVQETGHPVTVVEVAKRIWANHEDDLRASGDLFRTWQYSMRWAAQALREEKRLSLVGRKRALK